MNGKKNGTFVFFRNLISLPVGLSIVIFLVTATISSLFGYSLWSWMNVLRFVLGGAIVCMLCLYVYFIKSMLFKKNGHTSPGM